MKRLLAGLLLLASLAALAALAPLPASPTRRATDQAGFLPAGGLARLDARREGFERATGNRVLVRIGDTAGDGAPSAGGPERGARRLTLLQLVFAGLLVVGFLVLLVTNRGLVLGIAEAGRVLALHFPREDSNPDELPDDVDFGAQGELPGQEMRARTTVMLSSPPRSLARATRDSAIAGRSSPAR